jgi:hypothetical protein
MKWRHRDESALAELQMAKALLEQGNHAEATRAAADAETHAEAASTRNAARTTLAWAALGQGYVERAKAALDRVDPPHALDLYCYAAVQAARGSPELAIQALELARGARSLTCDGAKLLIDLYALQNRIDCAVSVALNSREVLGADNCRIVLRAARQAGMLVPATALATSRY